MSVGFETKAEALETGAAARERREEIDVGIRAVWNILITRELNPCDGSPTTLRYRAQQLAHALRIRDEAAFLDLRLDEWCRTVPDNIKMSVINELQRASRVAHQFVGRVTGLRGGVRSAEHGRRNECYRGGNLDSQTFQAFLLLLCCVPVGSAITRSSR